jgi:hypothetical protein
MAATVWSLERTAGPSKTHWGTIRLFGTILFIGLTACLAIWFTAQLRDRRQRAAFIAILAPEQLERLRGFERVKGDWREFRDLLHRRDRQQVDMERMTPSGPMAVAVDWLDAYRAARINQIVGLHSPDAVIECACGDRKIIHGIEAIAAYWRHRFIETPALELEDLRLDGAAVVVSYRTSGGIVEALLGTASDGRITRCRCGPIGQQAPQ